MICRDRPCMLLHPSALLLVFDSAVIFPSIGILVSIQKSDLDIDFQSSLSTYDFSTLFKTLPRILIKDKLLDLIERTFYKKEGQLYRACNDKKAFFTSADHYREYYLWSCQNVCGALSFSLDNII